MFRSIQNHPLALLAAAAVAFGAWLWYDAAPGTAAPVPTETADVPRKPHPAFPHEPHGDARAHLAHLPPGVPRAMVEHKLGLHPLPHGVSAISIEDGSATYTVTYPVPGRPLVLEFDATLPGHPFVSARTEPHS